MILPLVCENGKLPDDDDDDDDDDDEDDGDDKSKGTLLLEGCVCCVDLSGKLIEYHKGMKELQIYRT